MFPRLLCNSELIQNSVQNSTSNMYFKTGLKDLICGKVLEAQGPEFSPQLCQSKVILKNSMALNILKWNAGQESWLSR